MPFTNVAKPTGASYTNIGKPTGGETIMRPGMTLGLLIPLTRPTRLIRGGSYTRTGKPREAGYTNIAKPT